MIIIGCQDKETNTIFFFLEKKKRKKKAYYPPYSLTCLHVKMNR
jgi:hypothetical protein